MEKPLCSPLSLPVRPCPFSTVADNIDVRFFFFRVYVVVSYVLYFYFVFKNPPRVVRRFLFYSSMCACLNVCFPSGVSMPCFVARGDTFLNDELL